LNGPGVVFGLTGIAILVSALARISPAAMVTPGFVTSLGFGMALGAGMLAFGVALAGRPGRSNPARLRWWAAAYFTACATAAALLAPMAGASWALMGYLAAGCVLLPSALGAATLASVASLHFALTWISHLKVALTGLPLTVLDLKIALTNPGGLWDALALPQWTRYIATLVVVVLMMTWLAAVILAIAGATRRWQWRAQGRLVVSRVIAAGVLVALLLAHLQSLYAAAARDNSTWQLEGVVRMADTMGVLPFIAYSEHLESQSTGDIYRSSDVRPPRDDEIRQAVARYIEIQRPAAPAQRLQPNIMVVLAESTFDPGKTFRLQGAWDNELFTPQPLTASNGLLRVNAMGGGTWITEFETIVGMDSRVFGYAGMYTHASLSPFVDRSIASYLRDRGYHSWAFFPTSGEFYNARHAYEHYGFDRILDSEDLHRGAWMDSDRDVAASVIAAMGKAPPAPFFSYVLFIENHAPHDCHVDGDHRAIPVHFAGTNDFTPNCALDEYLRRLGSTTAAVRSLLDYLQDTQTRTGRPFVLLVFGDHQPHTFSGTGGFHYDYRPLRAISDTRTTFYHLLASDRSTKFHCCDPAPPAAMLPTLLSAYAAGSVDDVYMGINVWLYERCGSDAIRRDFQEFMSKMGVRAVDQRTDECRIAYERSLAWYREADVIRLTADPRPKASR
jgi:phosphoglycerol transferase MdoB-like AlkP superfamily enzyme